MSARSIILAAGLTGAICSGAHALGIVRAPAQVTLGATLNFAVAVNVASDETLTSPCVTADVLQGDQRVAPSTLRIQIEPGPVPEERIVRITSTTAIEEPFVTITIGLGCGNRLERRFTVLADPPLVTVAAAPEPAPPVAANPVPPAAAASAPRTEPAAQAPRAEAAAAAGPSGDSNAAPARPAAPRAAAPARPAAAASAPVRRAARPPATAPATTTTAAAPTTRGGAGRAAEHAAAARGPPPATRRGGADAPRPGRCLPRWRCRRRKCAWPQWPPARRLPNKPPASRKPMRPLAADRMRQIEEGVAKLRADIERDREQMLTLRAQLARAETTSKLAPWLGAGMALLAALALWLWLRMRRLQREQQAQWWAASRQGANTKQPPVNPPTLHPMTLPPHMASVSPPTRPAVAPAPPPVPSPRHRPAARRAPHSAIRCSRRSRKRATCRSRS